MAMNVGERFLDDTEERDFKIVRHAAEIGRDVDADTKAGTIGEVEDVGSEDGTETGFFEQRRMEECGHGTNFAKGVFDETARGGDGVGGLTRGRFHEARGFAQSELDGADGLGSGFMKDAG